MKSTLDILWSPGRVYAAFIAVTWIGTFLTSCKDEIENTPPTAFNVTVAGLAKVGQELNVSYQYTDSESDLEGQSKLQWYVATSTSGQAEVAIAGATGTKLVISDDVNGKFLRVGVTPMAATGVLVGTEVKSAFTGAIEDETEVTFTYNNQQVTYGIIVSATGRKWLDRNLGAANPPAASNDWANFGDLFQWGRRADGHQTVVRTGPYKTDATVTGTTPTLSINDNPSHTLFITNAIIPNDWRSPQNNNLWQGLDGVNNPCPRGWRLPTEEEWSAEGLTSAQAGYTKLRLTFTGYRVFDGEFVNPDVGRYWTSTTVGTYSRRLATNGGSYASVDASRVNAYACRCIKNQ